MTQAVSCPEVEAAVELENTLRGRGGPSTRFRSFRWWRHLRRYCDSPELGPTATASQHSPLYRIHPPGARRPLTIHKRLDDLQNIDDEPLDEVLRHALAHDDAQHFRLLLALGRVVVRDDPAGRGVC